MKYWHFIVASVLAVSVTGRAIADDGLLRMRALRQARKLMRSSPSADVHALKNTTFDGVWGGRYVYHSGGSTCSPRIASFDFRHMLVTKKSSGYLSTNHDGDFTGRSRDKGRRWEFVKGIYIGGRPAGLAIVYQNLARNGKSAATGAAISVQGGCLITYVANSIRLAR
jgi:hypothetical protein